MSKDDSVSANKKEKTVTFLAAATVNGKREVLAKQKVSYARLVSTQSMLASVVLQLVAKGTDRIADAVDEKPDSAPGGSERLNLSYTVDHGNGGGSGVNLDYTGINSKEVQNIVGMFKYALGLVQSGPKEEGDGSGE